MSDLGPLAGLSALQSLDCSGTQVSDLGPLAGLSALQSLYCSETQVSDLGPLAGLSALQSLDCSGTQVSDLGPLAGLSTLQSLNCSGTQVSDLPGPLVWLESLNNLVLFNTRITDIPAEVLSPDDYTDCLESLRAHLRDLEVGEERLPDVKVLVLGNGSDREDADLSPPTRGGVRSECGQHARHSGDLRHAADAAPGRRGCPPRP